MKTISLIGSTGSIGTQVLAVVRRYPQRFQVKSMVANSNAELFLQQVAEFKPAYAALVNEQAAKSIAHRIPEGVRFAYGTQAALDAVEYALYESEGTFSALPKKNFRDMQTSLPIVIIDEGKFNEKNIRLTGRDEGYFSDLLKK